MSFFSLSCLIIYYIALITQFWLIFLGINTLQCKGVNINSFTYRRSSTASHSHNSLPLLSPYRCSVSFSSLLSIQHLNTGSTPFGIKQCPNARFALLFSTVVVDLIRSYFNDDGIRQGDFFGGCNVWGGLVRQGCDMLSPLIQECSLW